MMSGRNREKSILLLSILDHNYIQVLTDSLLLMLKVAVRFLSMDDLHDLVFSSMAVTRTNTVKSKPINVNHRLLKPYELFCDGILDPNYVESSSVNIYLFIFIMREKVRNCSCKVTVLESLIFGL